MSPDALVLAIDQGTHASRALVFDARGGIVSSGEQELALARPQPGWAEQDGEEVIASVFAALERALAPLGARRAGLALAGLSSQRASCVCWDRRDGRPLSPVFSWQDRRAHAWIAGLEPVHGDAVHRKTGLYLSPHYGASKLRWALEHLPPVGAAAQEGFLAWGPLASFLVFRLLKERPLAADPQCAARTQLWNLATRDWDPELLALFGLPQGFLPKSMPTCHDWGTLDVAGPALPLKAVNGDQSAAVFAFGWPEPDSAYVNIGTSAFVQRALEQAPGHVPRQLTGIILDDGRRTVWMVEGNVNGAGTALEWLRAELKIEDVLGQLPHWLEQAGEPPLFLNGIAGLGGPFWQAEFASRFIGDGEPWQQAVAVVESIAFLLQANIDHMAAHVPPARRIRVSGGVSRLDGLCRRLAAVSGLPVLRRDDPEASARGIAYLAAGRPAGWNSAAKEDRFEPAENAALAARYRRWRELMKQATGV
ncbi:MAG TPA: FGGY family carbohydrate kinase [Burkholderiales bacterium]|nr:FGGY family carbohydrate kinase [Burkholderiales bacterium]